MTSKIINAARVAHEANRAWCEANGDLSQTNWGNAPSWQRESAVQSVMFHMENPDAGDSASHDNWMKQNVANGWAYGQIKDADAKTHPCMVPFEDLPQDQQIKDALFRAVVHAVMGG